MVYRPPTDPRIIALSTKSLWRWCAGATVDWLVIFIALWGAMALNVWWGYIIGVLIIGTRQHALLVLGHEGAHVHITSNLLLNDFLTNILCFWPVGTSLEPYRAFHFRHHDLLGTPEDPEMVLKYWSAPAWDAPASVWRVVGYVALDLTGLGILVLKKKLIAAIIRERSLAPMRQVTRQFQQETTGPSRPVLTIPLLVLVVAMGILMYIGLWPVVVMWFVAAATSFTAVSRLRIWTEHVGTSGTHRFIAPLWQRLLFLPHNTWYHFEHHVWDSIPAWNLPLSRPLLQNPPVTSAREVFATIARSPKIPSGAIA